MNGRFVVVLGLSLVPLLSEEARQNHALKGQEVSAGKLSAQGDGKDVGGARGKNQAQLVAQLGHSGAVYSVAFSPDGKQVLTGGADPTARLWDAASGREIRRFEGHSDMVYSVAFSPNGKQVLTGSSDKTARLWNAASGQEIRRFEGHSDIIYSVAFSPDGKQLLTGCYDKTARLFDVSSGKVVRRFKGHGQSVFSVAFSPDGNKVLTGSWDQTARLWDTSTGKEIRRFKGHSDWVNSVAFSPDGKQVLTGSVDKTARLWDATDGKEVRRFKGHSGAVSSVVFSKDGRYVLTGSGEDATARLWDAASGQEVRRFKGHSDGVFSVAFSGDGTHVLTGSGDKSARLWDATSGQEIHRFEGHSDAVFSVAFLSGGKQVLTGGLASPTARLWDLTSGQEIRRSQGNSNRVSSLAFSPDGKQVTGSMGQGVHLWDATSGKVIRRFDGHSSWVDSVAFSPDGKQVVTANDDKTVRLWDATSGKEIRRFEGHFSWVPSVAFSPDGKQVLTADDDKTVGLWDATSGKEIRRFEGHSNRVASVTFSPDGKHVLTGSWDQTARLWDTSTGKESRRFEGHSSGVSSVAFSPDGKLVLTGSWDKTARLWDAASGKEVYRCVGHTDNVKTVAFSLDGKHVLTGSSDQTTRLWDTATGKEFCSLVTFRDGSWAVIDAEGRFDASNGGNVNGLHWVVGNEPIALAQLKERYFDPGLLAKYMGFNKEPLRSVEAFKDVGLYPSVKAQPPDEGSSKLSFELTNQGGGLGKVQIFVNGREFLAIPRGEKYKPEAASAAVTVDLAGAFVLPGEVNDVKIVTWNSEGYLSSRSFDLEWVPVGKKDERLIELHAIVAGVSNYDGEALKLRYAGKDAEDMSAALVMGGKKLFGADKVHLTLLSDSGQSGAVLPTRANLEKAFADARKSRPGDVLVVYLAGHGIALPEGGQEVYCYLTKEARTANREAFQDPAVRKQYAITSTELTEWFKQIPALKQVLILDTCAAGAAAAKLMEHRTLSADQIRAIDRLKDRTGFQVLMGCAADRVSYEASKYSQGVLTYALLQGMRGAALREGEYVDVSQLFQYAADEVPQLARYIGGIQKPLVLAPKGTSFDVGRLQAADKKLIPLALVRPLVLRPLLLNDDVGDDDLGLMPLLRKRLLEESYVDARGKGKQPAAVFVDADDMPGAVRPSGKYTVKGDNVKVDLKLRRDGKTVATLAVGGLRTDLPDLVRRMVSAITERLQTLKLEG